MITQLIVFGIRILTIVTAPLKRETPMIVGADALGQWVVEGPQLLAGLHAVAAGEDPALVYAELYANSPAIFEDVDEDEGLF